jgi:diguanylate cyclase (GGDEF)-like protein
VAGWPTILCVDDDPVQLRVLEQMVKAFRYGRFQAEMASSYGEGLEKLVGGNHAVCLLDYRLDSGDGLQLLREARRSRSETPVIVLTGDDSEDVNIAALEAGALDYLVKGELTARLLERSVRYAIKLGDTVRQLGRLALHDELTGLVNRRELYRLLNAEWQRSTRFHRTFAIALADIDDFKRINDGFGHPAGDRALCHVAHLLSSRLRRVDCVARFGGEEFAILMPETGRREAVTAMERVRLLLRRQPFELQGQDQPIPITMSFGIAVSPPDADSADALIEAADRALYAAKHNGRDCVCTAERVGSVMRA